MSNFTDEGRRKGQRVLRERLDGWPKVTTTWAKAMKEGFRTAYNKDGIEAGWGRRFDEPGMVIKFKPNKPTPKSPWRYCNENS